MLDKKARFARARAARGWGPAYQGSCIGPLDQSHPLDLVLKAPRARRTPAIRLLINDYIMDIDQLKNELCLVSFTLHVSVVDNILSSTKKLLSS